MALHIFYIQGGTWKSHPPPKLRLPSCNVSVTGESTTWHCNKCAWACWNGHRHIPMHTITLKYKYILFKRATTSGMHTGRQIEAAGFFMCCSVLTFFCPNAENRRRLHLKEEQHQYDEIMNNYHHIPVRGGNNCSK